MAIVYKAVSSVREIFVESQFHFLVSVMHSQSVDQATRLIMLAAAVVVCCALHVVSSRGV